MSTSYTTHTGITDIINKYDGFILDQFGVMHNGTTHLPGADVAVQELVQKYKKKLIVLSNSSSLSIHTIAKLPKLGFDPTYFIGAVTSGQEAAKYIQKHLSNKKALFITWKTPKSPSPELFLHECGRDSITVTTNPKEADFILLHGCEVIRGPGIDGIAEEISIGNYHETGDMSVITPILEECSKNNNIPLICANPDYIMVRPDHTQAHMPGTIADCYAKTLNGTVISFGKPHKEHFEACIEQLGLDKSKVVHIGDSIHHDIQGANDTGIASIFVTGGVHNKELGEPKLGELPNNDALQELFNKHKQTPTHVVPLFRL